MAVVLDGKKVAQSLKERIIGKILELSERGKTCGLAIILVGDDAASGIYAGRLAKLGENVGVRVDLYKLPALVLESELLALVEKLNADAGVQGILPMMPLPSHLNADRLASAILPEKDVDSINPVNAGLVASGRSRWASCTPRAVMAILDFYQISLSGRNAVIIGRSNVVGKPLFHLLLGRDATVTVCHSKTPDLAAAVRRADIVIAAAGKAGLVTADMVKPGAIVIDVGINEADGKIFGDVDFEQVAAVAAAITPVPGGVGAVSTIMVMEAVLRKYWN